MQQNNVDTLSAVVNELYMQHRINEFSQSKLDSLTQDAINYHQRTEEFGVMYPEALIELVIEKSQIGYRWNRGENTQVIAGGGFYRVWLAKPLEVIDRELIEIRQRTEADYRASVEANRQRLIAEIAEAQLKYKAAVAEQAAKVQRELDLAAEIKAVQEQLQNPSTAKKSNSRRVDGV